MQNILSNITNYLKLYNSYFTELKLGENILKCPFHDDKHASFSLNTETGQYICHACGVKGNAITFLEFKGMEKQQALEYLCQLYNIEIPVDTIPQHIVLQYVENLNKEITKKKWLIDVRGFTEETIKKFKLGYDGYRYTIPIYNFENECINIRRYDPFSKESKNKMISYKQGYGKIKLFPIQNIKQDEILICEGETDCILANQKGFNAITGTGGAGSFKNDWVPLFKDKIVYICYDIDNAGHSGATNVAEKISKVVKTLKIINLPITEPANGDITDYFVSHGFTANDFKKLIEETPFYEIPKLEKIDRGKYTKVHLSQATNHEFFNKHITMKCLVAGKDLAPYLPPQEIDVICEGGKKWCNVCPMFDAGRKIKIIFDKDNPVILRLIDTPDQNLKQTIKEISGIQKNCKFEYNIVKTFNIENIYLIPEIEYETLDKPYVYRHCFYIGYDLELNKTYNFKGYTVPEPKHQYSTQILTEAETTLDNYMLFKMTPEKFDKLKNLFSTEDIDSKLEDIYTDFAHNITRIFNRIDLHIAVDLCFHSVLSFNFNNEFVKKGWADVLIIGDTRTGKGFVSENLIRYYELGYIVSGENVSFAGLVGGMQQTAGRWSITWGKIPLNNGRIICIDELSGMSIDDIGKLSRIRSEGIAEIDKIQKGKTTAMTRTFCISNPRKPKPLNTYNYGVEAIKELIGRPEDIARFDFAITVASDEVDINMINQRNLTKINHKYIQKDCHDLIMWIWSRKPEQIKFTEEATDLILRYATIMGQKYSSAIPLVEGANQRIKIAKIAVMIAGRIFNTEDGDNIVVDKKCVEWAYSWLERCYTRKSMGYDLYSEGKYREQELKKVSKLDFEINELEYRNDFIDGMLDYSYIKLSDIMDLTGKDIGDAKKLLSLLVRSKALDNGKYGYVKTPAFIVYLKKIKAGEKPINKQFENLNFYEKKEGEPF